jgi:hypothetical protein
MAIRKYFNKMEITVFCHLFLAITPHHVCHILFSKCKSLGLDQILQEIVQGHKYQEADIIEQLIFNFFSGGTGI